MAQQLPFVRHIIAPPVVVGMSYRSWPILACRCCRTERPRWRVGGENDGIKMYIKMSRTPFQLEVFHRNQIEGSNRRSLLTEQSAAAAGTATLRSATPICSRRSRRWFAEYRHKIGPQLERAWCQVALAEEGLEIIASYDFDRGCDRH